MRDSARGRYDRSQSPAARRAQRRVQLIRAAAEQLGVNAPALNVGELVRRARVDRNAYYDTFGDRGALERALIEHVREQVRAALSRDASSRTPGEALRQWLRRWTELARDERVLIRACANAGGGTALVELFAEQLERWSESAAQSGVVAGPPDPLRLQLIAGAIVHAAELAPIKRPAELASALSDFVLRALR